LLNCFAAIAALRISVSWNLAVLGRQGDFNFNSYFTSYIENYRVVVTKKFEIWASFTVILELIVRFLECSFCSCRILRISNFITFVLMAGYRAEIRTFGTHPYTLSRITRGMKMEASVC